MRLKTIFSGLISGLIAFAPLTAMADEKQHFGSSSPVITTIYLLEKDGVDYAKLASVVQKEKAGAKHSFLFMRVMHILHLALKYG